MRAQRFWHTSSCSGKCHLTLCLAPSLSTLFCYMQSSKAWPLECFSFPGKRLSLLNWSQSWSIACGIPNLLSRCTASVCSLSIQVALPCSADFRVHPVNWHIVSNPQGIMPAMCSSFALSMDLFPDLAECVANCAAGLLMVCPVVCDFGLTLSFTSLRDAWWKGRACGVLLWQWPGHWSSGSSAPSGNAPSLGVRQWHSAVEVLRWPHVRL